MLSLLFPPTCLGCRALLRAAAATASWPDLLCTRCAEAAAVLPTALTTVHGIDAVLPYQPPWSDAIARLKFGGEAAVAGPLATLLARSERLRRTPDGRPWDAMLAVPLHRRRRLQRGFDQALLLARFAAATPGAPPVLTRALRRVRATKPQTSLPAHRRAANVQGAFAVGRPQAVAGRRVLVVDDVTTTGATLACCCHAVHAAGAAQVGALALLRTVHG